MTTFQKLCEDQLFQGEKKPSKAFNWSDIANAAKCFPEMELRAIGFIRKCLGYLPDAHIYQPSVAFIQTHLASLPDNEMPRLENDGIFYYARQIRMHDMVLGGWVKRQVPNEQDWHSYETTLSMFKAESRQRLISLLGYEPLLENSMPAEIYLRQLFTDPCFCQTKICESDFKAMTVVRYRELYFSKGKEAADHLELIGLNQNPKRA